MSDNDRPVQRGPNYDWEQEAQHYSSECDKLRRLLQRVEASAERAAWELTLAETAYRSVVRTYTGKEVEILPWKATEDNSDGKT